MVELRMDSWDCISEQHVQKERQKARELRRSQWWRNRLAAGTCYYCHSAVPPGGLTLDHVVPLIRGGRSTKGNCVPACKECNSRKKDLLPVEWEEYLSLLRQRDNSE